MAKQSKKDAIAASVKSAGGGKQSIETKGDDFGAREMWGQAANPSSVKAMVGKTGEFSPYKHDNS
jgi:hypothetical protein